MLLDTAQAAPILYFVNRARPYWRADHAPHISQASLRQLHDFPRHHTPDPRFATGIAQFMASHTCQHWQRSGDIGIQYTVAALTVSFITDGAHKPPSHNKKVLMITLYAYGAAFGLPDASPFVIKTQVLLKMAGLPFEINTKGMRHAPKGKLPYIDDEGVKVADSNFIRWYIEKKYGFDFDQGLSAQAKGIAWSVERLLEDHLYWIGLQTRWLNPINFERGPANFFKPIPWPLRPFIIKGILKRIARDLHGHGMGRYSLAEQQQIIKKNLDSLAAILADQPYLTGQQICGADATLFAFLCSATCPIFESPIRDALMAYPNLGHYVERLRLQFYP